MRLYTKIFTLISTMFVFNFVIAGSYNDTATISSVKKIYKDYQTSEPYKYCYRQEYRKKARKNNSATNEILGGIIGGAIGNQFGKGSGKDAATIAGVLLGASIAHDSELEQDDNNASVETRRVCETRYKNVSDKRFSHYEVTYRYNRKLFTYGSEYKVYKGNTIPVIVSVDVDVEN